jgi:hypothetical protein
VLNVPQAKDELEVDGVRGVPVDEEQEQDLAVVAAPKQTNKQTRTNRRSVHEKESEQR